MFDDKLNMLVILGRRLLFVLFIGLDLMIGVFMVIGGLLVFDVLDILFMM